LAVRERLSEAEVRAAAQVALIRDGLRLARQACYRCHRTDEVLALEIVLHDELQGASLVPASVAVVSSPTRRVSHPDHPFPPHTGKTDALMDTDVGIEDEHLRHVENLPHGDRELRCKARKQ
jgi:hypothetical protein